MTATLKQLELSLNPTNDPSITLDVAFMHRSLCIAGLPVRQPLSQKENTDHASFTRRGTGFDLSLLTQNITIPNTDISVQIGSPYGPKARLITIWLASQAKLNRSSRFCEFGPIKDWLKAVGIPDSGPGINQTKAQLIKLSRTIFNVTVRNQSAGSDFIAFSNERLISGAVLATDDVIHYRDGEMDKVRWPIGIEISHEAWQRFERDAVPIPMARLREIAHSATAIDLFLYLSYRLPLIPEGKSVLVPWKQLSAQFGMIEGQTPSKFRENCAGAIRAALRAYPEARIEDKPDGLLMFHSEPAILNRSFLSLASPAPVKEKKRRSLRNRVVMHGDQMMG